MPLYRNPPLDMIEHRRNLMTNPLGDVAPTLAGYIVSSPSVVVTLVTGGGARVAAPADGIPDRGVAFPGAITYAAGVNTYTVSLDVTGEVADGWKVSVQGSWVDVQSDSAYVTVGVGETVRITHTFTTNAAGKGMIYLLRRSGAVASQAIIRHVLFEKSPSVGDYFDGSTDLGVSSSVAQTGWTGPVNGSASVLLIPDAASTIDTILNLAPYEARREARTIPHRLMDDLGVLFTWRPPSLPSGRYQFLFDNRTAAYAALNALGANTAWTWYDQTDSGDTEVWFMVADGDLELMQDLDVPSMWVLSVPYVETEL